MSFLRPKKPTSPKPAASSGGGVQAPLLGQPVHVVTPYGCRAAIVTAVASGGGKEVCVRVFWDALDPEYRREIDHSLITEMWHPYDAHGNQ